jgi:hypothetical protein
MELLDGKFITTVDGIDARASRIKTEMAGNIYDEAQLPTLFSFMTDAITFDERVFGA